jgi:hypothetical protein
MRRSILAVIALVMVFAVSGCEYNGLSSQAVSGDILREVESICGVDRNGIRGGVENIMLMENREDDGIVTCHDGTNHYFDA